MYHVPSRAVATSGADIDVNGINDLWFLMDDGTIRAYLNASSTFVAVGTLTNIAGIG
jgi:hypothetical protein